MAQQQPVQQLDAVSFLSLTKPKRMAFARGNSYTDGQTQRFQLPQAGLTDKIILAVQCTVTVAGTVTGGTFNGFGQGNPAPWSILKRFQFYSNNSLYLMDISGYGLYKYVRYRTGMDPIANVAVNYSPNTLTALGVNQSSNKIVAGAAVAAGTYTFNFVLEIPVAYNQMGVRGMLSLQNNNTIYNTALQWGQITSGITATGGSNDLFNGLTGTGLTVTANIATYQCIDFWDVPNINPVALGELLSTYKSVTEYQQTPLVSGNNQYRPPQNDLYTMLLLEIINNGTQVTPANIQNPTWIHSGNAYDMVEDYPTMLARDYFQHGIPGMDGMIAYDLGMRRGIAQQRDLLDAFNDQSITNLTIQWTHPSTMTVTGVNQVNIVAESLNVFGG